MIAAVAGALAANLRRGTDFVARYGGGEFVAILMGSDPKTSFDHLRKVRQAVEDLHIPHTPPDSEWVTVSVGGITVLPKNGDTYQTYLKIADTMLYDAKRYGRNRVTWCGDGMEQWREK